MYFLSDGADNLRKLQTYLNAESTHILDWFHITMRLTVLNQYVLGMLKVDNKIGNNLQELVAWKSRRSTSKGGRNRGLFRRS